MHTSSPIRLQQQLKSFHYRGTLKPLSLNHGFCCSPKETPFLHIGQKLNCRATRSQNPRLPQVQQLFQVIRKEIHNQEFEKDLRTLKIISQSKEDLERVRFFFLLCHCWANSLLNSFSNVKKKKKSQADNGKLNRVKGISLLSAYN